MNTSKIIKGVVGGGRYTVTAPIIKEDYGLYLLIEGLELPSTYEVDFSNDEHNGTSVTMIGNADGVLIPSQFISTGKDIFAFLYHVGVDFGRTLYKFRIPNKLRPDRTDEQPTPEEQSTIDQAISALNTAVEQTAQDVIDAGASAQSASADAERAEEARTDAQNYAIQAEQARDDAQTYANNASASATASAQSAEQAQTSAQTATDKADSIHDMTATAQTLPEGSEATASYNAETGVMYFGIPVGATGAQGAKGDKGDKGDTGAQGVKGDKGDKGDTGATGDKGERGERGPQGIQGERGPKGDDYTLTEQDKQDIADLIPVPEAGGEVISENIVNALLQIARKAVYIDDGGPQYYDDLLNAFGRKTSRYLTVDDIADSTGYSGLSITDGTATCTSVATFSVFVIDPSVMPIKLSKSVSNDSVAYTIFKDNGNGSYYGVDSSGRTFLFEKTQDNTKLNATQVEGIGTITKTGDTTGQFIADIDNGVLTCTYANGGIISFTNANVFGMWGSTGIRIMPIDCEVNYNGSL